MSPRTVSKKHTVSLVGVFLLYGIGCVLLASRWWLYPWLLLVPLAGAWLLDTRYSRRPRRIEIPASIPPPQPEQSSNEAQELSAKFLANVSHECRTPLSTVIGYADCMLRGYDGAITDEQRQDLQAIIRNARDLLQMLEDVLQLAKVEAGRIDLELQPFSIESCVQTAVQSLQMEADQRELQLHTHVEAGLPPILGDPAKVRRILLNLVQNAIKYTMQGEVEIRATAVLPYARLEVRDTGAGIPANELPHIFEPFYQGGIGKSGAGLGLSIVKSLVDAHAGRIEVESNENVGTRFTIFLPLAIPELKVQIRSMLEQKLEPQRREIAYRLYQWLDLPEDDESWQEANVLS